MLNCFVEPGSSRTVLNGEAFNIAVRPVKRAGGPFPDQCGGRQSRSTVKSAVSGIAGDSQRSIDCLLGLAKLAHLRKTIRSLEVQLTFDPSKAIDLGRQLIAH